MKCNSGNDYIRIPDVTPYAGVWIEIDDEKTEYFTGFGHSLRGSVD